MAKQQQTPYDFSDFSRLMKDFQIPGVDWQEVMASQQKNVAALTRANQLLLEGAQAVVQREMEILQRAMAEAVQASQEMMKQGDPQASAARRLELARASFEAALKNMRELAEMASQSNRDALEVINQRALESFEEIRKSVERQRTGDEGRSKA
jgi:phasin family protein